MSDPTDIIADIHADLTGYGYRRLDPQLDVWVPESTAAENWPRAGDTAVVAVAHVREYDGADEDPEFYSIVLVKRTERPVMGFSWCLHKRVAVTSVSWPEAVWTAAWWALKLGLPLALRLRDLHEVMRRRDPPESGKGENRA